MRIGAALVVAAIATTVGISELAVTQHVRFLDVATGEIRNIPPSELPPNAMNVQVQGVSGKVWIDPRLLQDSPIQHPPLDEETRAKVAVIQQAFSEVDPQTLEDWVDSFRRESNLPQELALWTHAALVFSEHAATLPSRELRQDLYSCTLACLTQGRDGAKLHFKPKSLSPEQAASYIDSFFARPWR